MELISHDIRKSVLGSLAIVIFSSCSPDPIEIVQPVVERIMYETVNELEQVPKQNIDGVWILDPSQQNINQRATFVYLKNLVWAKKPGIYNLGLSSGTECQIQTGGFNIEYTGGQGITKFEETAYGMYNSDTIIQIHVDTVPAAFYISTRNTNSSIIYLVEHVHGDASLNIEFDTWYYAASEQNKSMNELTHESWSKEITPTQSRIKTLEDRYFRREAYNEWTYANGILLNSFIDLYNYSGEQKIIEYVKSVGAFIMEIIPKLSAEYFEQYAIRTANYRMFRKAMLDDTGAPTLPYLELYKISGRKDYLALSQEMADYVSRGQERLPDGTFCRPEPLPGTVWSDDLFMASSLIAQII